MKRKEALAGGVFTARNERRKLGCGAFRLGSVPSLVDCWPAQDSARVWLWLGLSLLLLRMLLLLLIQHPLSLPLISSVSASSPPSYATPAAATLLLMLLPMLCFLPLLGSASNGSDRARSSARHQDSRGSAMGVSGQMEIERELSVELGNGFSGTKKRREGDREVVRKGMRLGII